MLLLSVALFGVFTSTIVWATDLEHLFWMRLVIGIGLGGMLPNVASIVADFALTNERLGGVDSRWFQSALGSFLS